MKKRSKQGRPDKYDPAFKIAVARSYYDGDLGYGGTGQQYGLSAAAVRSIVSWYDKRFSQPQTEVAADPSQKDRDQELSNEELQKQLKEARLKIAGLQTLIEVASKELGVDILKKPGTKQSSK